MDARYYEFHTPVLSMRDVSRSDLVIRSKVERWPWDKRTGGSGAAPDRGEKDVWPNRTTFSSLERARAGNSRSPLVVAIDIEVIQTSSLPTDEFESDKSVYASVGVLMIGDRQVQRLCNRLTNNELFRRWLSRLCSPRYQNILREDALDSMMYYLRSFCCLDILMNS